MVVPSLSALFTDPPRQCTRNRTPVLSAVLFDHLSEDVVFFAGPRPLRHECVIFQLKPAIEALDLAAAWHHFADLVPSLISVIFD